MITSGRTQGTAAEKGCNWGIATEADAVGEQQLKQTQLGCSLV